MTSDQQSNWWTDAFAKEVQSGAVDQAIFERFAETHGYDAATPMSWLRSQLDVLRQRVSRGDSVELYSPHGQITAKTEADFRAWAARYFPGATV